MEFPNTKIRAKTRQGITGYDHLVYCRTCKRCGSHNIHEHMDGLELRITCPECYQLLSAWEIVSE